MLTVGVMTENRPLDGGSGSVVLTPPFPVQLKAMRDQLQLFAQTPLKAKKTSRCKKVKEKERAKLKSSRNKVKVQRSSGAKGSQLYVSPLRFTRFHKQLLLQLIRSRTCI